MNAAKSKVALIKDSDRYNAVRQALKLAIGESDFSDRKQIVVKPNFVAVDKPLACTHVDAVRATLDVLREHGAGKIVLAEGSAVGTTIDGFYNMGYTPLLKEYSDIEFRDLNRDDAVNVQVFRRDLEPITLRLARTIVDSDLRVSVCPPKTHDTVIVTATLKNVLMGTLIFGQDGRGAALAIDPDAPRPVRKTTLLQPVRRKIRAIAGGMFPINSTSPLSVLFKRFVSAGMVKSDKVAMHQSIPVINLNLARLTRTIAPHLAVIDGHVGMEGNGPVHGTAVPWGIALAGFDSVAVDATAARLMGFDPDTIGYLAYSADAQLGRITREQIALTGNTTMEDVQKTFKPHETVQEQLQWNIVPGADQLVTSA